MYRGNIILEYVPNYVLYDLETTGLNCNSDKIIEIAAIKVVGGKQVDSFSTLVNPKRDIPYGASNVNGITNDMVKDSPTIDEVFSDFMSFCSDSIIVGHNIKTFDNKFIIRECESIQGRDFENDCVDTLPLAKMCVPDLNSYKLGALASYFGISTIGAHRALNDCIMNQKVYECLGKILKSGKIDIRKCPVCGKNLKRRNGRYGEFMGCSGYPGCRYTEDV